MNAQSKIPDSVKVEFDYTGNAPCAWNVLIDGQCAGKCSQFISGSALIFVKQADADNPHTEALAAAANNYLRHEAEQGPIPNNVEIEFDRVTYQSWDVTVDGEYVGIQFATALETKADNPHTEALVVAARDYWRHESRRQA